MNCQLLEGCHVFIIIRNSIANNKVLEKQDPKPITNRLIIPRPLLRVVGLWRGIAKRLLLFVAIYAFINLLSVRFVVDGSSMLPNFESGQFLIVSRLHYLLESPQIGDIVVFHFPGDTQQDYIKRVIAGPSDTVEIRDSTVYVNSTALTEPYIYEACISTRCRDNIWHLGEDEYFMMGDNRNRSSDSRNFGPVNRQFIVGEVVFRYFPLSDFGSVTRIGYDS